MTPLDLARTAYIQAFQKHPLHRLKGKLPEREILSKIGDALSHSQEWMDYQNAWIAVHGVPPIFPHDWEVTMEQRRRAPIESLYVRKKHRKTPGLSTHD